MSGIRIGQVFGEPEVMRRRFNVSIVNVFVEPLFVGIRVRWIGLGSSQNFAASPQLANEGDVMGSSSDKQIHAEMKLAAMPSERIANIVRYDGTPSGIFSLDEIPRSLELCSGCHYRYGLSSTCKRSNRTNDKDLAWLNGA